MKINATPGWIEMPPLVVVVVVVVVEVVVRPPLFPVVVFGLGFMVVVVSLPLFCVVVVSLLLPPVVVGGLGLAVLLKLAAAETAKIVTKTAKIFIFYDVTLLGSKLHLIRIKVLGDLFIYQLIRRLHLGTINIITWGS